MAPKRGRPPGARGAGKAKAKAKAAPKATAAPKAPAAPQAATRDASDAELEETLSDDSGGVSTAKKRRQLNRRSSDEQVERALAQRLSHLPDEVWRTKVNKDGLSISEYVKRAHKKMHSDGKKLGTKFWSDVYNEFDLNESCADALEDPPPGFAGEQGPSHGSGLSTQWQSLRNSCGPAGAVLGALRGAESGGVVWPFPSSDGRAISATRGRGEVPGRHFAVSGEDPRVQ